MTIQEILRTGHSRSRASGLAVLCASTALTGCVGLIPPTAPKGLLDQYSYTVGAEPLGPLQDPAGTGDLVATKVSIGKIIQDSRGKCDQFLQRLYVAETNSNAGLDLTNTIFSALATAFSPPGTKTALSAAATITGGWKSALDSDVYAKAAIANYFQAIQTTYNAHMKTYTDQVDSTDDVAKLIPAIEYTKIQSIHAECSLAAAQSAISATLQTSPTGQPDTGNPEIDMMGPPPSMPVGGQTTAVVPGQKIQ